MRVTRPGLSRRLHRMVNPAVRVVLRSRAHRLLSGSVALLTVTGRRTGTAYSFPVQYVRSGRVVIVVPGGHENKTWWRNVGTSAPVRILIAGGDHAAMAQALVGEDQPEEVADALVAYVARFRSSRVLGGLRPDRDGRLDRDRLLAAARRAVVVRILLDRR